MNISDFIVFQSSQVLQIRLSLFKLFKFFVADGRKPAKQQTQCEEPIQQEQKAGIVMSLNNTTLTKVTYSKYATRVPDEVAYGIYEWFSSQ